VNVATVDVADDVGLNPTVTPVGWPVAANVTLPAKGLTSVTVIVSVPLAPGATVRVLAEEASVKPPVGEVTVTGMLIETGVSVPEFPVTVTVEVPIAAAVLAFSVSTVEVAEETGLKEPVIPVDRPDEENVTLPVNGLMSVTVMVTLQLPPWIMVHAVVGGFSLKPPPGEVTVSVIVVVTAASVPEVPVIVIGYIPATVVEATVNVATLEVVEDAGLNPTVTPVGWPDAPNVTLPANGLTSVTVIVSVPLEP
jgi:hypothetical protein